VGVGQLHELLVCGRLIVDRAHEPEGATKARSCGARPVLRRQEVELHGTPSYPRDAEHVPVYARREHRLHGPVSAIRRSPLAHARRLHGEEDSGCVLDLLQCLGIAQVSEIEFLGKRKLLPFSCGASGIVDPANQLLLLGGGILGLYLTHWHGRRYEDRAQDHRSARGSTATGSKGLEPRACQHSTARNGHYVLASPRKLKSRAIPGERAADANKRRVRIYDVTSKPATRPFHLACLRD